MTQSGARSASGSRRNSAEIGHDPTDLLDALRTEVRRDLPRLTSDLAKLVNIDSGTFDKAGVDAVGRWAQTFLHDLGASVEVRPDATYGDTVVGTFRGALPTGPRLLLVAHMDTVFDTGTATAHPFRIDGTRAFGPGIVDMKGGLLVGLYALRALTAVMGGIRRVPVERIVFLANSDEEIGSPSSVGHIRRAAQDADVAFVLEAARANGDIVSARKGVTDLRVAITGRAAHAGVEPERGRSAIVAAARLIDELQRIGGTESGVSVNIGSIAGGTRTNVVAERCLLEVEVRAARATDLADAESRIARALPAALPDGTSVDVEVISRVPPMERLSSAAPVINHALRLASLLGMEIDDVSTGGGSDANTIASLGVPTLDGLGPVGGEDHSPAEYLELDSLVPRTALLAALLVAVARDPACCRSLSHTDDPTHPWHL